MSNMSEADLQSKETVHLVREQFHFFDLNMYDNVWGREFTLVETISANLLSVQSPVLVALCVTWNSFFNLCVGQPVLTYTNCARFDWEFMNRRLFLLYNSLSILIFWNTFITRFQFHTAAPLYYFVQTSDFLAMYKRKIITLFIIYLLKNVELRR